MSPASLPAISIVTATYNRSRALACTIESARRQSFTDWEMVIVGDACTDDTAEMVARIEDPRIRFVNLTRNWGEQAGPNNVGFAESRAPLVAFLNHDDLWLPDHLHLCREALLAEQADLVFSTAACIGADSPLPLRFDALRLALIGIGVGRRYSPGELEASIAPASSWLVRRDVLTRLRGWRLARDCHIEPSQDLLFRAWRAGFRIRAVNLVTLVQAASGHRPGSYLHGGAPEQEWFLERLSDPALPAELAALALETNAAFNARSGHRPPPVVRWLAGALARVGINPRVLVFRLARGHGRGTYIAQARALRGLLFSAAAQGDGPGLRLETVRRSCLVDVRTTIDFAAGAGGARFLASGWSRPEGDGVWNDGDTAELLFDLGTPPKSDLVVDLQLRPFLGSGDAQRTVVVSAGGVALETWKLGAGDDWHRRLAVPATAVRGSLLMISFRFENPASPRSLGLSEDPRQLAMGLIRACIETRQDRPETYSEAVRRPSRES
jgi:GT2 family glycosyltransferase